MQPALTLNNNELHAVFELYDRYLKPGCDRLLELNQLLLKAERKQRIKQIGYRLGWVGGTSALVIIASLVFDLGTVLTVAGLLLSYLLGLILHHKFSPQVLMPEQEAELYELNDELREHILKTENSYQGSFMRLLQATGLEERVKGMYLEQGESLTLEDINGEGLYHYLDAMNQIMEQREKLKSQAG